MANHHLVTRAALAALPERTAQVWKPASEALADEYCAWPDRWFDPAQHRRIAPYMLVLDGLQFHYPPMSRPNYLYWMVHDGAAGPRLHPARREANEHWSFFRDGMRDYLRRIREDLRARRLDDAAKRLGILLHFFQDTHALHALEGPWGTDCFVLEHLVDLPEDAPFDTCLEALAQARCDACDIPDHRVKQEGEGIDEAVLRLYTRYVNAALANRRLHLPIVNAVLAGDRKQADDRLSELYERLARLSADLIQTVTAVALDWPAEAAHAATLREVHLDELAPIERPWLIPGPYRFGGMRWRQCRDSDGKQHPLMVRDEAGQTHEHERGWGSGAHVAELPWQWELPFGVYQRLQGRVGLHATLGQDSPVTVTVRLGHALLLCERLDQRQPSVPIDLPVEAGGMLTLAAVADDLPTASRVNLAWLDMRLVRAS